MKIFSDFFKNIGFTFSFRRFKKAVILVIFFAIIATMVAFYTNWISSEEWIQNRYKEEVANKYNISKESIIKVLKEDVNDDSSEDVIFVTGQISIGREATNAGKFDEVVLYLVDGKTESLKKYETNKTFTSDATLNVFSDDNSKFIALQDKSGNITLCKMKKDAVLNSDELPFADVIAGTADEFLGYTIYTRKDDENKSIIGVTLDNFKKDYLEKQDEEKIIDFSEAGIDISKYRETYIRDKYSEFVLKDIDVDGNLELICYQYILHSLDENEIENKTIGIIETIYSIEQDKLKFKSVNVSLF